MVLTIEEKYWAYPYGTKGIKTSAATAINARATPKPNVISFLIKAMSPHSSRCFSYSSISFFTSSSKDSHSSLNLSFLNFSYVSLETRIWGYSDFGLPLTPGIIDNMDNEDIKVLSLLTTLSTNLLRRCA